MFVVSCLVVELKTARVAHFAQLLTRRKLLCPCSFPSLVAFMALSLLSLSGNCLFNGLGTFAWYWAITIDIAHPLLWYLDQSYASKKTILHCPKNEDICIQFHLDCIHTALQKMLFYLMPRAAPKLDINLAKKKLE